MIPTNPPLIVQVFIQTLCPNYGKNMNTTCRLWECYIDLLRLSVTIL